MDDISKRLWEAMPQDMKDYWEERARERDGVARQCQWLAEDGWLIVYSTDRVTGGPHDGKFVTMAYRPVGTGARGGRRTAQEWRRVYVRGFAKRRTARARAEALFYRHSPKAAARQDSA